MVRMYSLLHGGPMLEYNIKIKRIHIIYVHLLYYYKGEIHRIYTSHSVYQIFRPLKLISNA